MANNIEKGNKRRNRMSTRNHNRRFVSNSSEISCCVKYAVFGFNVIFWIIGFLLLAIGVWARIEKNSVYSQLNKVSKFYMDPAWILIITGFVIFMIGFSGCVGALRENTCFLALYSSILGLLLLSEALIVISIFFSKDVIENDLTKRLDDMIYDPDDWNKNIYFNSSAKTLASPDAGGVPFSCCKDIDDLFPNFACGQGTRLNHSFNPRIHNEGCLPKLQNWMNNNFIFVGTLVFIIAFLGICFAQDLRSDIFAQRSKWIRQR